MEEEKPKRKVFAKVEDMRLLDIIVYLDDVLVYEGRTENVPDEVKKLKYSEIEMNTPMVLRCYNDVQE